MSLRPVRPQRCVLLKGEQGLLSALHWKKKKKIAIFSQSKEGKSPLHMAAIHGRFTRSQILIQNGTDSGDFVLSSPPENSFLEAPLCPDSTSHTTFQ